MRGRVLHIAVVTLAVVGFAVVTIPAKGKEHASAAKAVPARDVAAKVDEVINTELQKASVVVAERCNDEDFLRRASLDIIGQLPTPEDVAAFKADSDADKRAKLIDKLLESPEFGMNWGRYWRDVIYMRATEQRSRLNQEEFTKWMADRWNRGAAWDETVSAMLTATGNVEEHPETALIFAQGAMPEDVTAEACRVFLGVQLQCANCHDHPSDIWKRQQFHELTAYFPRISERRVNGEKPTFEIASVNTDNRRGDFMHEHPDLFVASFDRNRDKKLSKEELAAGPKRGKGNPAAKVKGKAKGKKSAQMADGKAMEMAAKNDMMPPKLNGKLIERLFEMGDTNKDGLLTVDEIKAIPLPGNKRRGSTEHYMADLKNPDSQGELIEPKFFVDGSTIAHGQSDEDRRRAVAHAFTSHDNPWFARAIVNRMWAEMLGEGFYMPVDDLGPTRSARFPDAMEVLCTNFVASGHDPKWLVRTIANTEAYQRKIQTKSPSETDLPFASATPVPLRSDVIFNSLAQVLGFDEEGMAGRRPRPNKPKAKAKAKDEAESKEIAEAKGDAEMKSEPEMKDKPEAKPKPRAYLQGARFMFDTLFGTDPSVPKDEIVGSIPQSLLMMNSRNFRAGMAARGDTRLAKMLKETKNNREVVTKLYLLVLAREPSPKEVDICMEYLGEVKDRPEAFEDLMWSLVNSSEFISRR